MVKLKYLFFDLNCCSFYALTNIRKTGTSMKRIKYFIFILGIFMNPMVNAIDIALVLPEILDTVKTAHQFETIPTISTPSFDYLQQLEGNETLTRVIFVRHGESNSNKEKSIAGRTLETDLSEKGVQQAQKIGRMLNLCNVEIHEVYSSPTLRTLKTAQGILSETKFSLQINKDERLHEKWYGSFEGATEHEYAPIKHKEETDIPLLSNFVEKFSYKADLNIESMLEVYQRVDACIKNICQNQVGKTLLITTHNGVMKSLFIADCAMRGYDVEYRSFDLDNCSVMVMEVNEKGALKVVATNGLTFKTK